MRYTCSARRGGFQLLAALTGIFAVAGCGGVEPAKAPKRTSPVVAAAPVVAPVNACTVAGPGLRERRARIEAISTRFSGNTSAGTIGSLQDFDEALVDMTMLLRASAFDEASSADATTAATELDAAHAAVETARTKLEENRRRAAAPLREAKAGVLELRSTCETAKRPSADCRAILKTLSDTELTSWTTLEAVNQAVIKVGRVTLKTPNSARALTGVKAHLNDASAAFRTLVGSNEIDVASDESAIGRHVKLAVKSLERLQKHCGELPPGEAPDWIAGTTDPRKLTVLVYALVPDALRKVVYPDQKSDDVESGSTGSGVVILRKNGDRKRAFVVTNRHVVDDSKKMQITIDGSSDRIPARVVYVDAHHDVAVLEVDADPKGELPFESGVALETAPATDQQVVVAAGYPGMVDKPSYQVTRGYISNHELHAFDDATGYIQHTAAIDPGSSGGPLLSERGRLLGINTLKLRGRESVALAVPGEIVASAVRAAENAAQPLSLTREARRACLAAIDDLATEDDPDMLLAPSFVANVGAIEYGDRVRFRPAKEQQFTRFAYFRDPLGTLRQLSQDRLQASLAAAGGVSDLETCENVRLDPASDGTMTARFTLQTAHGPRELAFSRELGRWMVASFDFRDLPIPKPAKATKVAAKKK